MKNKYKKLITEKEIKMLDKFLTSKGFIADIGQDWLTPEVVKFLDDAAKEGKLDKGKGDWQYGYFVGPELRWADGTSIGIMGGSRIMWRHKDFLKWNWAELRSLIENKHPLLRAITVRA